MAKQMKKKQKGRSMIEMLGVLAIIGVLSIVGLFGFNYAMNRHKANETIHDVMIRGTNVPMVDEYYASKPSGYQFLFPDLTDGTYYAMETLKDTGKAYHVDVTAVPSKVCTQVLNLNPTDIDAIVVEGTLFTGNNTGICGNTPVQMRFCFGTDGTVCNGSSHGGGSGSGGTGSGSGSGSGGSGSGTPPCTGADCGPGGCTGPDCCVGADCGPDGCTGPDCCVGADCGPDGCTGPDCCIGAGCHTPCITSADCTGALVCVGGHCQNPDCTSDGDCEALEICQAGVCVPVECKTNSDCGANEECDQYTCVPKCGACEERVNGACQTTCLSGQTCSNGTCVCQDKYQQTPDGTCIDCETPMNGADYGICVPTTGPSAGEYRCCCFGGGGWTQCEDGSGHCVACVPPKVFDGSCGCVCPDGETECGLSCCGDGETCVNGECKGMCEPNEVTCTGIDGAADWCCDQGQSCGTTQAQCCAGTKCCAANERPYCMAVWADLSCRGLGCCAGTVYPQNSEGPYPQNCGPQNCTTYCGWGLANGGCQTYGCCVEGPDAFIYPRTDVGVNSYACCKAEKVYDCDAPGGKCCNPY